MSSIPPDRHARRRFGAVFAGTAVTAGLLAPVVGPAGPANAAGPSVKAGVKKGVLTVVGTQAAEVLVLRLQTGNPESLEVDVGGDGTAEFRFKGQAFTAIDVRARGGDDTLRVDQTNGAFTDTETTTLAGEDGNDSLVGGFGAETLLGGAGEDSLDGNLGADVVDGGDGGDVIAWDPGDASDTIRGGGGADRLAFNGANIGEQFDVSNAGGHVWFTRNIGTVTLDVDDVEALDLRTLGGADVVTVHDLTGTDLTAVRADLAGFDGGDDVSVDSVVVPAGTAIGRDGGAAVVTGLGAVVQVRGGSLGDEIRVDGAGAADVASIDGTDGVDVVSAAADGATVVVSGATPGVFVRLAGVESTEVDLAGGDDQFSAAGDVASVTRLDVDGGAGNDTLSGGNGPDTLFGGAGDDVLDGNMGADVVDGGDGADVIAWDPGDASDTIRGGGGADRLAFNGANIGEQFDVSNAGGHVRFTRNIGTVTLDVDDVEALDLRALGGADVVTVHDLTGTDLTAVRADLAGFDGGDDLSVDSVVVPPGTAIGQDGGAATVHGLGAVVRVAGGSAGDEIRVDGAGAADVVSIDGTDDADVVSAAADGATVVVSGATPGVFVRLAGVESTGIDLAGGDDQFSAAGDVASVTRFDVDGGAGNDTLSGGNGPDTLFGGAGDDVLDGNMGADVVDGGDGADVIAWNPGDASDTIRGGGGADRLMFNGANIGEQFDVSNAGGHVRFTRNIGTVTLDVDDVEALDLRALGGADVVTVNDLTGTDLAAVKIDLAGATATPDASADTVTVRGTSGADTIAVGADGVDAVVQGLPWTVRVRGADPSLDRLVVDGAAGADALSATAAANLLLLVELVQ